MTSTAGVVLLLGSSGAVAERIKDSCSVAGVRPTS